MTKRQHIPVARKREKLAMQAGLCACGCGRRVGNGEAVEWDHIVPVALGGGNNIENLQGLAPACHAKKTRGTTMGERLKSDVFTIAKAKRIARKLVGGGKPKAKIQSRGFDKRNAGAHKWPKRKMGKQGENR